VEGDILEKIAKVCPQYKFTNPKKLGSGSMGTAWDVGNNIVLKITHDRSEANASNIVKGKKLKYTNEIYDVFKITYPKSDKDAYLIFQKKLDSTSKEEEETITDFTMFLGFDEIGWNSEIIHTLKDTEFNGLIELFYKKYPKRYSKSEKLTGFLMKLLRFYVDSKKELLSHEVDFNDYHGGNIMKDGDVFKIIDLGFSKAPDTKIDFKLIESFRKYFNGRVSG